MKPAAHRTAILFVVTVAIAGCRPRGERPAQTPVDGPQTAIAMPATPAVQVARGVWFQQQPYDFGSNVAWVELDDGVVVYDTAFPRGAQAAVESIRRTTGGKPVRYVVVSHYHHDHAFGTGVFARAHPHVTIISHEQARRDHMARNPAQYAAWAADAKKDPGFRAYALAAPNVTFRDRMVLEGHTRSIELLNFGRAHTTGDVLMWIPDAGVMMTGDACDNGPYNYVWDSDTASWISVLEKAEALAPRVVLPGHGERGGPELLSHQRRYLVDLRAAVQAHVAAGHDLARTRAEVTLPAWQVWGVGRSDFMLTHVEHAFHELSGHKRGSEPSLGIVDAKATAWPGVTDR